MKEKRKICIFCGAKKYTKFMKRFTSNNIGNTKKYICQNTDFCVKRSSNYRK